MAALGEIARLFVEDGWLSAWRSVDEWDEPGLTHVEGRARAMAASLIESAIERQPDAVERQLSNAACDGTNYWLVRIGPWICQRFWDPLVRVDAGEQLSPRKVRETPAPIWPDYPLVDYKPNYERADVFRARESLGLPGRRHPEPPDHPLWEEWQSDAIPRSPTVEAFEQWCRCVTDQIMPSFVAFRRNIFGAKPWEEVDDDARKLVRDAHFIVRYCHDTLGLPDPPEEPGGTEFSLNDARIELRRVGKWLRTANGAKAAPKKRGRRKASYEIEKREEAVAHDWKRALGSGVCKVDFAKQVGRTMDQLDRLLDRVAKRKKRAGK